MPTLEDAALSGELFQTHRSLSPARSLSTASSASDDDEGYNDTFDAAPASASPTATAPSATSAQGGAQTGPKGVITDRKAHERSKRRSELEASRRRAEDQEKHKIVASTVHKEDELRERERLIKVEDDEIRAKWRAQRMRELENRPEREQGVKKGGLREVGREGFLSAVERPGWVVVLIYEPDVPRCSALLASTLSLSLSSPPPPISLLRARATSLEFSLLPADDDEEPRADPDVLPTMLAYHNGELAKTWIRVDWEVRADGVEGLLKREGILPATGKLEYGRDLLSGSDEDD